MEENDKLEPIIILESVRVAKKLFEFMRSELSTIMIRLKECDIKEVNQGFLPAIIVQSLASFNAEIFMLTARIHTIHEEDRVKNFNDLLAYYKKTMNIHLKETIKIKFNTIIMEEDPDVKNH